MDPWNKDTLHLKVGDELIWQGEEIKVDDGSTLVSLGMKGQVISLHDGFQMDLVQGGSVPPKTLVQFESGESLLVDQRMKWGRSVRDEATGERSVYLSADC